MVENEEFTPNGASSGHFPEDQAERVDIRLLEWLKAACIDGLVQDFRSHVPAQDRVIRVQFDNKNILDWFWFLLVVFCVFPSAIK